MGVVYFVIFWVIVLGVFAVVRSLIRKGARAVPTAGNIARAHARLEDERARRAAQNAAADEIINSRP